MDINPYLIGVVLFVLGLVFGSYACASAWRFKAKFLAADRKKGKSVDENEFSILNPLADTSFVSDYSRCLHCRYKLKWYDMIPVVSWLVLGGKCRKCRKPIGLAELLSELGLGLFFVLSFVFWPTPIVGLEIAHFVLWLAAGVILTMIFIYDLKWLEIPTVLNYIIVSLGVISSLLFLLSSSDFTGALFSVIGSALILSGIYLLIYFASNRKWIGFGDILLGLGLALMLGDWRLAYIALFAANFIGCVIVLPGLLTGRLKRTSRIPFGPLLIVGYVIAGLFGAWILSYVFNGML